MPEDIIAELRRRVTDPLTLAKFERFARSYTKRMAKLGPDAGVPAMMDATMACWRKAFGVEWPATQAGAVPPKGPAT